jgi:hypothetical protein
MDVDIICKWTREGASRREGWELIIEDVVAND